MKHVKNRNFFDMFLRRHGEHGEQKTLQIRSLRFSKLNWNLRRRSCKEVNRKRSQPVFAFIVAAGDVGERGLGVGRRRSRQNSSRWIVLRQSGGDAAHAPGAAEIQAIEMHEFWIGAISHDRWLQ